MATGYDAFISYKRDVDGSVATTLESAVERFAKPWNERRSLRLFRDQTSLAADPLRPSIEAALQESRYLVLLATPAAAASEWVAREIDFWIQQQKPVEHIIIVQTGGADVHWDDDAGDFAWETVDALPPNLKGKFTSSPMRFDLRAPLAAGSALTRNPVFIDTVASIAATLLDRPKDELIGEDLTQHRRALFLARGAIVGLALLLAAAVVAAVLAVAQREEARRQASVGLAALAVNQVDTQLDLGLLLGLEALDTADTPEARGSLLTGVVANPQLARYLHGGPFHIGSVAYSPDGTLIAGGGSHVTGRDNIAFWDATTGQLADSSIDTEPGSSSTSLSPDGQFWSMTNRVLLGPPPADSTEWGSELTRAFSWDGDTIATISYECRWDDEASDSICTHDLVTLWDAATGQAKGEPLPLDAQLTSDLSAVAFNSDETTLAIGSRDGTIILWDLANERQIGEPLRDVQFLGFQFGTERGPGQLERLVFSPDGRTLAAAGERIVLWDLETREVSQPLNYGDITARSDLVKSYPAFSPDGSLLAIATCDWNFGFQDCVASDIVLWKVADKGVVGSPLVELGTDREVVGFTSVAFSPDGTQLVSGTTHKGVMVWNVSPGFSTVPVLLDRSQPSDVTSGRISALSPDGALLAIPAAQDNAITVWDIAAKHQVATLHGHTSVVSGLAFSPDASLLASRGAEENSILLWDIATGQQRAELKADAPLGASLAFTPDGTTLAAISGEANTIQLWSVADGERIGSPLKVGDDELGPLAFSPGGKLLAAGGSRGIYLLDIANGRVRAMFPASGSSASCLAFTPDGSMLVAGRSDNLIEFWDITTGTSLGLTLAGETLSIPGLGGMEMGVNDLDFLVNDKTPTLVSGGQDGRMILWDVARRRPLGSLQTSRGFGITDVEFSNDGKRVISAHEEPYALTHDLDTASWRKLACRRANRNLRAEEWTQYFGNAEYHATCPEFPPGNTVALATPAAEPQSAMAAATRPAA